MPHDHGAILQFDELVTLTLGTLGANTSILANTKIDGSRDQGFHLIWVKIAGFARGKTSGEGPVLVGICCNLDAATLAAILTDDIQSSTAPTSTGPGSWYYPIVSLGLDLVEGNIHGDMGGVQVQNTSPMRKIPVKWTIPEGSTFNTFAHNLTSGALTTGTLIGFTMQYFGAWLRD